MWRVSLSRKLRITKLTALPCQRPAHLIVSCCSTAERVYKSFPHKSCDFSSPETLSRASSLSRTKVCLNWQIFAYFFIVRDEINAKHSLTYIWNANPPLHNALSSFPNRDSAAKNNHLGVHFLVYTATLIPRLTLRHLHESFIGSVSFARLK